MHNPTSVPLPAQSGRVSNVGEIKRTTEQKDGLCISLNLSGWLSILYLQIFFHQE
jgi:hypothetical protein